MGRAIPGVVVDAGAGEAQGGEQLTLRRRTQGERMIDRWSRTDGLFIP